MLILCFVSRQFQRDPPEFSAAVFVKHYRTAPVIIRLVSLQQPPSASASGIKQLNACQFCVLYMKSFLYFFRNDRAQILQKLNSQIVYVNDIVLDRTDVT